jgi:hypothetical protein
MNIEQIVEWHGLIGSRPVEQGAARLRDDDTADAVRVPEYADVYAIDVAVSHVGSPDH